MCVSVGTCLSACGRGRTSKLKKNVSAVLNNAKGRRLQPPVFFGSSFACLLFLLTSRHPDKDYWQIFQRLSIEVAHTHTQTVTPGHTYTYAERFLLCM